jgi:hypothetical protein
LDSNIEFENENLVNIVINYYSSLGDIEGFGAKKSLVFDKISGEQLKLNQLFSNPKKVEQLIENKFRTKYKIPLTGTINTNDFCFENNHFKLTDNIVFDIEGLTFVYNINEIAPYDKGTFEVYATYEELDDFLLIK